MRMTALSTFFGLAVLFPVYATADANTSGFYKFTISNVAQDAGRLWAAVGRACAPLCAPSRRQMTVPAQRVENTPLAPHSNAPSFRLLYGSLPCGAWFVPFLHATRSIVSILLAFPSILIL
jgi:hypothetical protein